MQNIDGVIKPEIGCQLVDTFEDEENEIIKVYAITREEWMKISCQ